jgi:hypothetical protein
MYGLSKEEIAGFKSAIENKNKKKETRLKA